MKGKVVTIVVVGCAWTTTVLPSPLWAQETSCEEVTGHGSPEVVADRAIAVAHACYFTGRLTRGVEIVDAALRALPAGRYARARAALLIRRGQLQATRAFITNRGIGEAVETLDDAVREAAASGSLPEQADALTQRGFARYTRAFLDGTGDFTSAGVDFDRAQELRASSGDARGLSEITFYQGLLRERAGDEEAALGLYREALRVALTCDCALEASYARRHIGFVLQGRGELEAALDQFERSLALREEVGFRVYVPFSLLTVADVRTALGRPETALPLAVRAERLAEDLEMPRVVVLCRLTRGDIASVMGDREAAVRAFVDARGLSEEIGYDRGIQLATEGLARLDPASTPD